MSNEYILGLRKIKAISDYQFGPDITDILFGNIEDLKIERSRNTNKIKYIFEKEKLLLSLRPTNGFFTLNFNSAMKIIAKTQMPKLRVVVMTEISEFIKEGRNVFCKHVLDIDTDLRPMDEVIAVNQDDELLAIGRLMIPSDHVKFFKSGIAINVRKGIHKIEK